VFLARAAVRGGLPGLASRFMDAITTNELDWVDGKTEEPAQ
jgi:hypothetical protein